MTNINKKYCCFREIARPASYNYNFIFIKKNEIKEIRIFTTKTFDFIFSYANEKENTCSSGNCYTSTLEPYIKELFDKISFINQDVKNKKLFKKLPDEQRLYLQLKFGCEIL